MALAVAVLFRPAVALAGVLCMYGLEQWAQAGSLFFVAHPILTNGVFTGLLGVALCLKLVRGSRLLSGYPRSGAATLALFAFAGLSCLWSIYPAASRQEFLSALPYLLTFIVLCPLLITEPDDLRVGLVGTLALGSLVLLLLLLTTEIRGRGVLLQGMVYRRGIGGYEGNPLAVASLAGYVALIGLLMNFSGVGRFWQAVRWFVVALGLVMAIRSGSRGQVFAILIAAMAFLPMSRRIRSIRGFIATCIATLILTAVAYWAYSAFAESARWDWELMVGDYQTTRFNTALVLLKHWAEANPVRWILGLGNSASFAPWLLGSYPHLVAAEVLAEEGFIGFALFSAVIVLTFRSALRGSARVRQNPQLRGVQAAIAALFLFELMLSFKQGSLIGSSHLFAFVIMLGRYETSLARQESESEQFLLLHDKAYELSESESPMPTS